MVRDYLGLFNGFVEFYKAYLRIKNDKKPRGGLDVEDAKRLIAKMKEFIREIENEKK